MKTVALVLMAACLVCPALAGAAEKRYELPVGDSPVRGPANAPVTIVEFIDFL